MSLKPKPVQANYDSDTDFQMNYDSDTYFQVNYDSDTYFGGQKKGTGKPRP